MHNYLPHKYISSSPFPFRTTDITTDTTTNITKLPHHRDYTGMAKGMAKLNQTMEHQQQQTRPGNRHPKHNTVHNQYLPHCFAPTQLGQSLLPLVIIPLPIMRPSLCPAYMQCNHDSTPFVRHRPCPAYMVYNHTSMSLT